MGASDAAAQGAKQQTTQGANIIAQNILISGLGVSCGTTVTNPIGEQPQQEPLCRALPAPLGPRHTLLLCPAQTSSRRDCSCSLQWQVALAATLAW